MFILSLNCCRLLLIFFLLLAHAEDSDSQYSTAVRGEYYDTSTTARVGSVGSRAMCVGSAAVQSSVKHANKKTNENKNKQINMAGSEEMSRVAVADCKTFAGSVDSMVEGNNPSNTWAQKSECIGALCL